MTDDERALLIKTAQALGSMSQLLASGHAGVNEFQALSKQINELIRPLVERLT